MDVDWLRWLRARFSSWPSAALTIGWALLLLWALGILAVAIQLGTWRKELSRTLLQLNADAQFRARVQSRDAVDPEWYRRKAHALLSANQRLQRDVTWTMFVPGSWHVFDPLEEQVRARIRREFADIVVETIRRELYARASKLTGVPLVRGTGELQAGAECQSPVPQDAERKLTAAAEDMPEFVAVADYVRAVEQLDEAVQSFLSLQYRQGDPAQMRRLVAYTLERELPGALAGAVGMFRSSDEVTLQPTLMQSKLQWATRCALAKAMSALHTRLLNTNELFALEQGLVERSRGLFEAASRPPPFDRTLERYRAVHALLEDQHALLARGQHEWMRQGTLQLGPAYQDVLRRIGGTRLLGPEVVQQLNGQSGQAFAEFRRQFEQAFGSRGEPGIVWVEGERRFALSTERAALREGLGKLLQASFMGEQAAPGNKAARDTLAAVMQEARALADEHKRVATQVVPSFPAAAQPVVQRVINVRVSELIYQRAYRVLKADLPTDPHAPLDAAGFRQQRDQVLALQAVLKETGGTWFGDKLVATLDGEVLRRLALLQEDWHRQTLHARGNDDFGWWHGEPLPLAQALGAAEATSWPPSLARTASRLDALAQHAKALMALGSPALAREPAAVSWAELQAELERYKARSAQSSLLRLERYLTVLGADLRRDNCAERLLANPPSPSATDDVAQRHLQLHQTLVRRCEELRAQPVLPAVAPAPAIPSASFIQ